MQILQYCLIFYCFLFVMYVLKSYRHTVIEPVSKQNLIKLTSIPSVVKQARKRSLVLRSFTFLYCLPINQCDITFSLIFELYFLFLDIWRPRKSGIGVYAWKILRVWQGLRANDLPKSQDLFLLAADPILCSEMQLCRWTFL